MTTWDGRLRIDHVTDANTVALTLVTLEAATELRLHPDLVVGFVTADPHGPPAFVAAGLRQGELAPDVLALLGSRVSAAVAGVVGDGRSGRWLHLDLVEVNDLANAWAPYRAVVLESARRTLVSAGVLGSWADELWTCLGLPNWRATLMPRTGPASAAVFRGGDRSPDEDVAEAPEIRGRWRLPDELATAVGVDPAVTWTLRLPEPGTADAVEILLRAHLTDPTPRAGLQAGLDDGSQRWVSFEPYEPGVLRARLVSSDEQVSVRFRSESGE